MNSFICYRNVAESIVYVSVSFMCNPTRDFFYNGKIFAFPEELYATFPFLGKAIMNHSNGYLWKVGGWGVGNWLARGNMKLPGVIVVFYIRISPKRYYWQRIVTRFYPLDVSTNLPLPNTVRTTKNIFTGSNVPWEAKLPLTEYHCPVSSQFWLTKVYAFMSKLREHIVSVCCSLWVF